MAITTLSRRQFEPPAGRASHAATDGPVFITDHGEPAHVLLSIGEYRRITGGKRSLAEALSMPGLSDIDLDAFVPARK